MHKPQYHFFLCNSFRMKGDLQGSCNRKGAPDLLQYLQTEIGDRNLDAIVSTTSCLNVCENGPILVIYPQELWYRGVTEETIDQILNARESGETVSDLLMT